MPRRSARKHPSAILLTPGAGASSDHSSLVALDAALSHVGLDVLRMDFPYRLAGRRIPDRPKVLVEAVTTTAESFARELGIGYDEMLLGGRSMGGRMCSMAVSDGLRAAGLVLISYPLHPPGRPDRLRSEHFPAITCPCLFVSGDRDPFGSPTELETATSLIAGTVTHHWIPGADHGLRGRDEEVARVVGAWIESF